MLGGDRLESSMLKSAEVVPLGVSCLGVASSSSFPGSDILRSGMLESGGGDTLRSGMLDGTLGSGTFGRGSSTLGSDMLENGMLGGGRVVRLRVIHSRVVDLELVWLDVDIPESGTLGRGRRGAVCYCIGGRCSRGRKGVCRF